MGTNALCYSGSRSVFRWCFFSRRFFSRGFFGYSRFNRCFGGFAQINTLCRQISLDTVQNGVSDEVSTPFARTPGCNTFASQSRT